MLPRRVLAPRSYGADHAESLRDYEDPISYSLEKITKERRGADILLVG